MEMIGSAKTEIVIAGILTLYQKGSAQSTWWRRLAHQLCEMERTLQHMKGTSLLVLSRFHFLLPEPTGLVTVGLPAAGVPDSQLETHGEEVNATVTCVTVCRAILRQVQCIWTDCHVQPQ
ncbi:ufm1-specific protease 2 [Lates japonicus]|uniref:Ufm1-specific protease 2 n=1 Tax=Lates japonicus TaxID=270547 RepID=A0AAD3MEP7_LATJO|nr:ufm1-specific protease 2 [Lates japonicus]